MGFKHKEQHENNDDIQNTMDLLVLSEIRKEVSLHSNLENNDAIINKDKNAHNIMISLLS